MSQLVFVSPITYMSQTVKLPQTASISEKASVKLERVRGEILKTQTFFTKIPESASRSIVPIINEYAGPDEVQEAQLSEDLLHSFENKNFKLSNFYLSFALIQKGILFTKEFCKVKSFQSPDTEKSLFLAKACLEKIDKQIASLSFAHSSVHEVSLSAEQTGILFSKFIEALDQVTEEFVPSERRNALKGCREILSELNHEALLLPVRHLYAKYGQKQTLMRSDGSFLKDWIRDIRITQRKYAQILPAIAYEEGDSQGFSFSIKKGGEIRGYLHGTMHYMEMTKLYDLAKISKAVQQRLYECALLGTEIAVNEDDDLFSNAIFSSEIGIPFSVEASLIAKAYRRGIANLGIDSENRDELLPGSGQIAKPLSLNREQIELLLLDTTLKMLKDPILQEIFSSYRYGHLEGYHAATLKWEEAHPQTKEEIENCSLRNTAMVENIDRLLGTCEEVSQEMQEAPLKCFFAVGVGHVISTKSNTVVELLSKKGYKVEHIP